MKSLSFGRAKLNGLPGKKYPVNRVKGKERLDLMDRISTKRMSKIMEELKYG
jgi:hypothetical protein